MRGDEVQARESGATVGSERSRQAGQAELRRGAGVERRIAELEAECLELRRRLAASESARSAEVRVARAYTEARLRDITISEVP